MQKTKILLAAAIAATVAFISPAIAEDFPEKAINVIMPYPTGTASDAVMRMVGAKLEHYWGQPVTFENRPGANNWVAVAAFKKAKPDGYTLYEGENFFIAMQRHVFKELPYDPDKTFVPVSGLFGAVSFLAVKSDSPWQTIPDIIAAGKDGSLKYGSSGIASSMHIAAIKLEALTGIKMTNVPFKDSTQAFTAIGNGDLDLAFASTSLGGPMVRAGKIRYLAYSDTQRNPSYPDVPTFAEIGAPAEFTHKAWLSVFAPEGTPQPIIDKLNAGIVKALNEPDVREKLAGMGVEPIIRTPQELAEDIAAETKLLGELAKANNISLD